jgi:hypothetical protein
VTDPDEDEDVLWQMTVAGEFDPDPYDDLGYFPGEDE